MITGLLIALSPALRVREKAEVAVADIVARHEMIDGRLVRVSGWMGNCNKASCTLYGSETDAATSNEDRASRLSLGRPITPDFDDLARQFRGRSVIVEGHVRAACWQPARSDRTACGRRAAELEPIYIFEQH